MVVSEVTQTQILKNHRSSQQYDFPAVIGPHHLTNALYISELLRVYTPSQQFALQQHVTPKGTNFKTDLG